MSHDPRRPGQPSTDGADGASADHVDHDDHRTPQGAGVGRTLLLGVVLVVAVLGGIVAAVLLASDDADQGSVAAPRSAVQRLPGTQGAPPRPAPEVLPTAPIEGFAGAPPVDPASYRGRPLVVNLWATWCPPCVEEMPHFQTVSQELAGDVAFLGVDVQDGPSQAEPFVAELGISYDLAADPQLEFSEAIGAFGMPTTLFVDEEGAIVHRVTGPLSITDLRAAIATHLGVS